MVSENIAADILNPSTAFSPSAQPPKKFSTATDDQSFIPPTMRALYYSPGSSQVKGTQPTRASISAQEERSLAPDARAASMVQRENTIINPRTGSIAFQEEIAPSSSAPRTVTEPTSIASPGASGSGSERASTSPAGTLILDTSFPTPQPATHQYLLKVHTAAFCQDELRLAMTLNPSKTTPQIPLHSVCGTVITTPPQDHDRPLGPKYKIGDVVWGVLSYTRDGGAADYVIANENELALKPPNITSAEAAALALPALTAWGALFRIAGIDPNVWSRETYAEETKTGSGATGGKGSGQSGKSGQSGNDGQSDREQRGSLSRLSFGGGRGFGFGAGSSEKGAGNGHRFSLASLTGGGGASGSGSGAAKDTASGSTGGSGRKLSMASIGNFAAASGRRLSLTNSNSSSGSGNGFRKHKPLRILVTNARDSEVGRVAVQLLRAEKLFPATSPRPWICVTCTVAEETVLRDYWTVDEILVVPHLPTTEECDLGSMFRSRKWDPVDIVLDCTGGEVFRAAHSRDVVRDSGCVLTAVDPKPVQDPATTYEQDMLKQRKRGLRSRFVPVNPDSVAMKRISELVEDRVLRGREEQMVDLSTAAKLLEGKAAGAAGRRRGGMMVVRINPVC
ncbi:hypothetical protein N7478_008141 [Penicillium angulare]|uniref:uncharacterized protein n=1 Tax=Penicillium angulare TaxID=116970 RepID=UPI00253FF276|nr:uncharacterized protein N7478_008141 [Penicillium angulare]KAJ5273016.1 hypothetical protein N7478_008141 [Penicillium angulare]